MSESRTIIAGSERPSPNGAALVGTPDPDERVEVSLYLKPEEDGPPADLATSRATTYASDLSALAAFACQYGLTVVEQNPARRLLRVAGPVSALAAAFGAEVKLYEVRGNVFRARTGSVSLPASLADRLEAVLGLDARHVARSKVALPMAAVPGFLPSEVARLYGVPIAPTFGQGQTIAIIELGGGFKDADTAAAFAAMGLPTPTVTAVGVGGAINQPGNPADGEVALDIQVAGAVAPGAAIAVYFAANTAQGFVDAISQAAHDAQRSPSVISISWGAPEAGWSGQTLAAMTSAIADAAVLGVTTCCASGDGLATDGLTDGAAHVDFPASAPQAVGCGGTRLSVSGRTLADESVWNSGNGGTGGGISDQFDVPAYQQAVSLPPSVNAGRVGRGVPDVAADADPNTGYRIVLDGATQVIGGTSAAAPLWAGIFAALNAGSGRRAGAPHDVLYGAPASFRDIVTGNNRNGRVGYDATPGWDACTGLGTPDWSKLATLFA